MEQQFLRGELQKKEEEMRRADQSGLSDTSQAVSATANGVSI